MTWKDLFLEGRVEEHRTSRQEISDLRQVVARDLADSQVPGISDDRRFATAYNAALQCSKMVVCCRGYRIRGAAGAHHITFECLKLAMGKPIYKMAAFLDQCRRKRNIADYDAAGRISKSEADEMVKAAKSFASRVDKWIRHNYPIYG